MPTHSWFPISELARLSDVIPPGPGFDLPLPAGVVIRPEDEPKAVAVSLPLSPPRLSQPSHVTSWRCALRLTTSRLMIDQNRSTFPETGHVCRGGRSEPPAIANYWLVLARV